MTKLASRAVSTAWLIRCTLDIQEETTTCKASFGMDVHHFALQECGIAAATLPLVASHILNCQTDILLTMAPY